MTVWPPAFWIGWEFGLGHIRSEIERQVARGDGRLGQDMQLTPRAKRVIDLAYDEARQLNNNYIGTEHLLLGLIREGEGLAGRVLAKLGVDLERTRLEVLQLQEGREKKPDDNTAQQGTQSPVAERNLRLETLARRVLHDVTLYLSEQSASTIQELNEMATQANADRIEEPGEAAEPEVVKSAAPAGKPSQRMAPPMRERSDLYDVLGETRLRGRDLLGIEQLSQEEILLILDVAARLKAHKFDETQTQFAKGQTLAMLFEKPSLRTRVTFEAGMTQLGRQCDLFGGAAGSAGDSSRCRPQSGPLD